MRRNDIKIAWIKVIMIMKRKIKSKYTYKDLDSPNYHPCYDQDSSDNLYDYVIQNMEEEF